MVALLIKRKNIKVKREQIRYHAVMREEFGYGGAHASKKERDRQMKGIQRRGWL